MTRYPDEIRRLLALSHSDESAEAIVRDLAELFCVEDLLHDLGMALHGAGRLAEAEICYRRAIALRPDRAATHNNLSIALKALGKPAEALAALEHARALRPDSSEILINIGNLLRETGQLDDAIAAYQSAISLSPSNVDALSNLAGALTDAGQLPSALDCYDRALAANPDHAIAAGGRAYLLHFLQDCGAQAIFAGQKQWAERFARPLYSKVLPNENDRDPFRRLRVGYVSPNYYEHSVGRFLLPLLAEHDKASVEIFCYADVARPDAVTEQLRSYSDAWRNTIGASDEQLAEKVRADQIDILIDLNMHLAGSRLLAFARKPAPVQVTYLAYCSTTGLETIDYRLTDPYLDPPGADAESYSEASLRLPRTYWCYQPPADAPDVSPLPAISRGNITFGCLNNFCKVSLNALKAWANVLTVLPNSRLILHAHEGSHRMRVQFFFQERGIDPSRIEFQGFLPLREYRASYDAIDIALDPFPFAGGTTTCDALWMGVPVVSLVGRTAVGRGGLSILANAGIKDLACNSPADYEKTAINLAKDLSRLKDLRVSLRERLTQSPLMDSPRFARDVEGAYRQMWTNWCRRQG